MEESIIFIIIIFFYKFGGISHLFCLFSIFFGTIHSFKHPFAEGPLLFPHCSSLSRGPPWGAEPGFELGPAVQQADALLSELLLPSRNRNSSIYKAQKSGNCGLKSRNTVNITQELCPKSIE